MVKVMFLYNKHRLFVQCIISMFLFALSYVYILILGDYIDNIYTLFNVTRDARMLYDLIFLGIVPIILKLLAIIYFIFTVRYGIRKRIE